MAQQNLGNTSPSINSQLSSSNNSKYQKSEPFLWFHIAMLSAVPLTMILGMVGLGVGDPIFPEWFEISIIGLPPIALPVILQWWKPLSPYSLWLFAKPLELTDDNERRILAVVKNFKTGLIAIAIGVLTDAIFCQMYTDSPLVAVVLPLPNSLRMLGIIWSLAFFLISNLLLQAGAVAIRVLLLSEADLDKLTPLPLETQGNVDSAFTSFGKRSPQLLDFSVDISSEPKAKVENKPQASPAIASPKVSEVAKSIDNSDSLPIITDTQIPSSSSSELKSEAEKSGSVETAEVSIQKSPEESPKIVTSPEITSAQKAQKIETTLNPEIECSKPTSETDA